MALVIRNLWKLYSKLIPRAPGRPGDFFPHQNASPCYRTKPIISNFTPTRWKSKQMTPQFIFLSVSLSRRDGVCCNQSSLSISFYCSSKSLSQPRYKRRGVRFFLSVTFFLSVGRMSRSLHRRCGIGDIITALWKTQSFTEEYWIFTVESLILLQFLPMWLSKCISRFEINHVASWFTDGWVSNLILIYWQVLDKIHGDNTLSQSSIKSSCEFFWVFCIFSLFSRLIH